MSMKKSLGLPAAYCSVEDDTTARASWWSSAQALHTYRTGSKNVHRQDMISWRLALIHHSGQFTTVVSVEKILALTLAITIYATSWASWGVRLYPRMSIGA